MAWLNSYFKAVQGAVIGAHAGQSVSAEPLAPEHLAHALAGQRLLTVLDKCEHVIAATVAVAETRVQSLIRSELRAR